MCLPAYFQRCVRAVLWGVPLVENRQAHGEGFSVKAHDADYAFKRVVQPDRMPSPLE